MTCVRRNRMIGTSWKATGMLVIAAVMTSVAHADDHVSLDQHSGKIVVKIDGKPFTEYIYEGHSKPILYPILGPDGVPMTRSYPMVEGVDNEALDHPHQKSLWFTHGNVNGIDFWSEYPPNNSEKSGKDLFGQIVQTSIAVDGNRITTKNNWIAPGGKILCKDERNISFGKTDSGYFIDYWITLKATDSEVTFKDTKEGTMGIRTHPLLRLANDAKRGNHTAGGSSVNSEGVQGNEMWGKRAKWVDYWGEIDGHEVGIAIFDHPSNLRHPTWWHARHYGLVAANPFGIHDFESKPEGAGDYTLDAGSELTLGYRFLFHRGDAVEANVGMEYDEFAKTSGP